MGSDKNLITLVVHTPEHAFRLKDVLEFHNIPVIIEDVVLEGVSANECPKKVRIPFDSLTEGLKILESGESDAAPLDLIKMTGIGGSLLIPVDFSPLSKLALKAGFYLADKFGVEPMVLHAYIAPMFTPGENVFADPMTDSDNEMAAVETADLRQIASKQLSELKKELKKEQSEGKLPDIKFSTTLLEGVPEQVILEYCKVNKPLMVVMATRGADKKESDLIGSVTAEVIDGSRTPVFTVPEYYSLRGVENIKRVAMFCTFSGFDVVTLRWLMRSFDYPACDFYLLPAGDRPVMKADRKLEQLSAFLNKMYPTANFHHVSMDNSRFDDHVRNLVEQFDIDLIIVPNKKSSAFSRFFRPTLAHRILFEKDIPLLVLPV